MSNFCVVRHCNSRSNGTGGTGAGIHVGGSDSVLEGNNCTDNRHGIHVISTGNFIVGNTCSGNTVANWSIAANNVCQVVNATLNTAFTGNSGGTSPGSTNPNVNYTF